MTLMTTRPRKIGRPRTSGRIDAEMWRTWAAAIGATHTEMGIHTGTRRQHVADYLAGRRPVPAEFARKSVQAFLFLSGRWSPTEEEQLFHQLWTGPDELERADFEHDAEPGLAAIEMTGGSNDNA